MTSPSYPQATVRTRTKAAMTTLFALAAALAVCVVMLFWTPLEAPASWRAANQTTTSTGRP